MSKTVNLSLSQFLDLTETKIQKNIRSIPRSPSYARRIVASYSIALNITTVSKTKNVWRATHGSREDRKIQRIYVGRGLHRTEQYSNIWLSMAMLPMQDGRMTITPGDGQVRYIVLSLSPTSDTGSLLIWLRHGRLRRSCWWATEAFTHRVSALRALRSLPDNRGRLLRFPAGNSSSAVSTVSDISWWRTDDIRRSQKSFLQRLERQSY